MAVAAYLENGGYDRHLRHIRQEYRKNLSAFQLAVQQYFPAGTQMTRPTVSYTHLCCCTLSSLASRRVSCRRWRSNSSLAARS